MRIIYPSPKLATSLGNPQSNQNDLLTSKELHAKPIIINRNGRLSPAKPPKEKNTSESNLMARLQLPLLGSAGAFLLRNMLNCVLDFQA